MPRRTGRRAPLPLLIINDVSESRRDAPVIRGFIRSVYGKRGRIVGASKIRKKVFDYLGRQQKYDLIFLGATGGQRIFMGGELARMGRVVKEIPYSMHAPPVHWPSVVMHEAAKLGEKPRILLLDSDVGPVLHTASKLADAKRVVAIVKKDAIVHIIAGAASNSAKKRIDFDFVAYSTPAKPVRLSEIMDKYARGSLIAGGKGIPETKKANESLKRLLELQKRRGMTGTLPH